MLLMFLKKQKRYSTKIEYQEFFTKEHLLLIIINKKFFMIIQLTEIDFIIMQLKAYLCNASFINFILVVWLNVLIFLILVEFYHSNNY